VTIITDCHEPESIAKALDSCQVSLPEGDYLFYGKGNIRILVERKTVSDVLNSLREKRLQDQLRRMLTQPDTISILLIEGNLYCTNSFKMKLKQFTKGGKIKWRETGWELSSIVGYLLTFQEEGVKIVLSPSKNATVHILKHLEIYYNKDGHTSLSVRGRPLFGADSLHGEQVFFLQGLPGIGEKRAELILKVFGSPWNAIWQPEKLVMVQGIGKKIVAKVERMLQGEGDANTTS